MNYKILWKKYSEQRS